MRTKRVFIAGSVPSSDIKKLLDFISVFHGPSEICDDVTRERPPDIVVAGFGADERVLSRARKLGLVIVVLVAGDGPH